MTNKCVFIYGAVLAGCIAAGTAKAALNCSTPPTCSSLGYTDSATYCPDNNVKCPFNTANVKCLKPYGTVGQCYYRDGSVNACKNSSDVVGMVLSAGSGNVTGFVKWVLLPYATTTTWNEGQAYCAQYGAIMGNECFYFDRDEINSFFSTLGKQTRITDSTTYWAGDYSPDKARRYIANSSTPVSKTERHMVFCIIPIY